MHDAKVRIAVFKARHTSQTVQWFPIRPRIPSPIHFCLSVICRPLTSISGITTPDHRLTRIGDKGNFISKAQRIHVDQCTADRRTGRPASSISSLRTCYMPNRTGRQILSQKARLLSSMATDRGRPDTFTETRYSAMIKATQILSARRLGANLQTIRNIIKFS